MPESDVELLTEVAHAAGEIAVRHFYRGHAVWEKGDGQGPVTEADLEVNAMLHDRLLAARPGYGWLSEESEDDPDRLTRSRVFVVDPIDGTRSFTEGHHTWAHSLAVVEDGQPVAAVVYLPLRDKLYAAAAGQGARMNGATIEARDTASLSGAALLAARPTFEPRHWPGGVPDVTRHVRTSLAYRICLVGEGRFDGMLTLRPSWEWDIAAGVLIATEAGAAATDRRDHDLQFNREERRTDGLVCAPPAVHGALIERLGGRRDTASA